MATDKITNGNIDLVPTLEKISANNCRGNFCCAFGKEIDVDAFKVQKRF